MLKREDATDATDRKIAAVLLRLTGRPAPVLPYTREEEACNALRKLMEGEGLGVGIGTVGPAADVESCLYVCKNDRDEVLAEGKGQTPALAICDAFLGCLPPGGSA